MGRRRLTAGAVNFASILLLALGLAMDATAVAAARGLAAPRILPRHVATVALFFGGFQALMPLVGWIIGAGVGRRFAAWSAWIAFALLVFLGVRMLREARAADDPEADAVTGDPFAWRVMLALAVATSLDALAAGVTLPMLHAPLALSLVTIGVTTAVLSAVGLFAGRRFGALLGRRLDAAGGLVLVGLGVKTLVAHLAG